MEQWEEFEKDAAELETWLQDAVKRLQVLSNLEDRELQNISAIKQKTDLFLVSIKPKIVFADTQKVKFRKTFARK